MFIIFSKGRMNLSRTTIFLFFFIVVTLVFFHTRGSIMGDEGYILNSSLKFFNGNFPYRDFTFIYTPGSIFLTALSFMIFSPSILASRILIIIVSLISCFLIYKVSFLATKNPTYGLLSTILFLAWGPTHINFSSPVMFVIPSSFLVAYLFLKYYETKKGHLLLLAGIASFSVFLFEQNFGFAIIFSVLTYAYYLKTKSGKKDAVKIILGFLWGIIFFTIYLLATDSFPGFVNNYYDFTISRLFTASGQSAWILYVGSFLRIVVKAFLYLLPFLLSISTVILLLKRRRFHLIFLPVLLFLFYVVSIRQSIDYVHLVPLLSISGILFSILIRYTVVTNFRLVIYLLIFILVAIGFQTAFYKNYYNLDQPLISHNYLNSNSKIDIFLSDKSFNMYNDFLSVIRKSSRHGDYIFVLSYDPMIYFVTDRKDPMRNNILSNKINEEKYNKELLGNLVAKQAPLVIYKSNQIFSDVIEKYLTDNYKELREIDSFIVLRRK